MEQRSKALVILLIASLITLPTADALTITTETLPSPDVTNLPFVFSFKLPGNEEPWWETTALDINRNRVHDSLDSEIEKGEVQALDIYLD